MQANNAMREQFEAEMLLRGASKSQLERRNSGRYCLASMNDLFDGFVMGRETLAVNYPRSEASVHGIQTEIAKPAEVDEFLRAQGVRV